tara:strand:- start:1961 stop:2179 length:219 start_codon:yes stop_codon:yes gene_type:complete
MRQIIIDNDRKFEVVYDIPFNGRTNDIVLGSAFNSQVFDLDRKDLINVSNLDVGKKVITKTYGDNILVRRVS